MSRRQRPIGIIGAMDQEIEELLKHSKVKKKVTWNIAAVTLAELEGQNVVIVKSGVGKVFAAMICERMIDEFDPKAVIVTGVAGALNRELQIGDVVVSTDCIQHDLDAQALGFTRGAIPYTEHRVFAANKKFKRLGATHKAQGE